ncbi:MAG: hypothetical protein COZ80_01515 [Ignavibacteria bacterium CG_4_8_14_3_um_filter_37_9]|nr:hypothetical protein [Ignavibacteria bacterium]PIS45407.1 MAG: hypothetical protein COT22_05475 [Ignavibacteria bacterium CG08_land_8_20_14_0_20_37_9]PIX00181.1 MAG: hypothetical protein COZ80_01515 [Ignavibacteria bacterium CG_4_8_14_3_um_filter_37_9]PIX95014.1 MAG: hypothetical protein COZ25_02440 [Ignavibacteria bacterium CG_4_10_14_3_um_filter_37_18]PJC59447.1 MAG: hypothetical protein CO025_06125 [Ignavibacteria bacterium CG_4_9_14_0_2_um_filter_37_13]
MFTKKNNPYSGLVLILTVLTFSFFAGCGKQEAPKQEEQAAETVKTAVDTTPQPVEEKKAVLDLKGTYTGTLDSRATTLKITDQTDSTFSGSITINYREIRKQTVSGKFSPEKLTLSMNDTQHNRYAGTYSAKLSADGKKISGTFTEKVDKSSSKFTLTKK